MSEVSNTPKRRKRLALRVYSRVHSPHFYRWWIAERIIWPLFIREYP